MISDNDLLLFEWHDCIFIKKCFNNGKEKKTVYNHIQPTSTNNQKKNLKELNK